MMNRHSILLGLFAILLLGAASPAGADVSETWESSPIQGVFDGAADRAWYGDLSAFAIEAGDWPSGTNIFGSSATKAIRSTNASQSVAGQYTVLTNIASAVDPARQIEWSAYVSGDSISIQTGYWFQMVLLANTSDATAVESPGSALRGYRLTISQRTVDITSDFLTLWKCTGAGWVAIGQADLGSAWLNSGWNLAVTRSPLGLWTVSHSTGPKGIAATVDFTVADTSVALTNSPWYAGLTWITKGTYHAPKFGFDDFNVASVEPPNLPPEAVAGADVTVTDADLDGSEYVEFNAGGSSDADGTITQCRWETEGWARSLPTADVTVGTSFAIGEHTVTLTITDDDGASDTDTVMVTVMPGGPWPPIAVAGPDQVVRDADGDGSQLVYFDGSESSDFAGAIASYFWLEGQTLLASGRQASATLDVGDHTVTLQVFDNEGLSDSDTLTVHVTEVGEVTDQITQHGITWTFAEPVEFGQFVNGDYWAIAPVTVASASPAPAGGAHGSMLNPSIGDGQAYHFASENYNASAGVSFPVTLAGGNSLVSTASWTDTADTHADLTGYTISADRTMIRDAAVLTVLNAVPPTDAFRPAYARGDKRIFRQSAIRYDLLPRLTPPSAGAGYDYEDAGIFGRDPSMTVAAQYGRIFQRPWLLHMSDWSGRSCHPTENMPGYHREVYNAVAVGACLLLTDLDDIDDLLIPMLQVGIDSYGVIATGAGDNSSDADSAIHKWPVLLTGALFEDAAMVANNYRYRTRWMTYYIPDGTSPYDSVVVPAGQTYNGYTVGWRQDPGEQEHEHLDPATEWVWVSNGGGSKRESYRRINSHSWPGVALAAHVMGLADEWADPAFFDYVHRWMTEEETGLSSPSVGSTSSAFVSDMWAAYRDSIDTIPGDANRDGNVDLNDFVILKTHFGTTGTWAEGDFNGDGTIDLQDFVLLKTNFGTSR